MRELWKDDRRIGATVPMGRERGLSAVLHTLANRSAGTGAATGADTADILLTAPTSPGLQRSFGRREDCAFIDFAGIIRWERNLCRQ